MNNANNVLRSADLVKEINSGKRVLKLNINLQKDGKPKMFTGSLFANTEFNVGEKKSAGFIMLSNDIVIDSGLPDPQNQKDPRNKYEGSQGQVNTKLSSTGNFAEFLTKINPQYIAAVKETFKPIPIIVDGVDQKKTFTQSALLDSKIKNIFEDKFGPQHLEKAGEMRDEPIIRLKFDEGNFSPKYPLSNLQGKPKFSIYDYNSRTVDDKGKPQYKLATIIDESGAEVPVTLKNAYKFVTNGCTLKAGSILMISAAIKSEKGVSIPMSIYYALIDNKTMPAGSELIMPDPTSTDDEDSMESMENMTN